MLLALHMLPKSRIAAAAALIVKLGWRCGFYSARYLTTLFMAKERLQDFTEVC
jgi:hypothetical protein